MTAPFNKIEWGIERSRIRQVEWRQVLAHARPDWERAAKARERLDYLDKYIAAETKLLAYLRRRLRLYEFFSGVDLPPEFALQLAAWTSSSPRQPPARNASPQLPLPLPRPRPHPRK